MKIIVSIFTIVCFFCSHFSFAAIRAQCLNDKGKTSACILNNQDGNLIIKYKMKSQSHLDRVIPGKNITRLTGGEYSRRRVAESITAAVLLAPVAIFGLFSKKKLDNFGVEYINDQKKPESTLIQIKKKYGEAVKSMLQSISGQEVVYQENTKK